MEAHRRLASALREPGWTPVFGLMGDGNLRHLIDFSELGGTVVTAVTEAPPSACRTATPGSGIGSGSPR